MRRGTVLVHALAVLAALATAATAWPDARFGTAGGMPASCYSDGPLPFYSEWNNFFSTDQPAPYPQHAFAFDVGTLDAREFTVSCCHVGNPSFASCALAPWSASNASVAHDSARGKCVAQLAPSGAIEQQLPFKIYDGDTVCLTSLGYGADGAVQIELALLDAADGTVLGASTFEPPSGAWMRYSMCAAAPNASAGVVARIRNRSPQATAWVDEIGNNPIFLDRAPGFYQTDCEGDASLSRDERCIELIGTFEFTHLARRFENPNNTHSVWLIGNEPNWFPTLTADVYARQFMRYRQFIRSHDPTAQVANGGLFLVSFGSAIQEWLTLFFKTIGDPSQMPDVYNIHIYPVLLDQGQFNADLALTQSVRDFVAKFDPTVKPLWITEFGVPNFGATEAQTLDFMDTLIRGFAADGSVQRWFWFEADCNTYCHAQVLRSPLTGLCNMSILADTGKHYIALADELHMLEHASFEQPTDAGTAVQGWTCSALAAGACAIDFATSFDLLASAVLSASATPGQPVCLSQVLQINSAAAHVAVVAWWRAAAAVGAHVTLALGSQPAAALALTRAGQWLVQTAQFTLPAASAPAAERTLSACVAAGAPRIWLDAVAATPVA